MHIVVVKQGQDHLELPSGVGTKHEQKKPTQGKTMTRSGLAIPGCFLLAGTQGRMQVGTGS